MAQAVIMDVAFDTIRQWIGQHLIPGRRDRLRVLSAAPDQEHCPIVSLAQAVEFVSRTTGVQAVYSGPCLVFSVRKCHGTGALKVYNGGTIDPLKVSYTPPAALPTPALLLDCPAGIYWDLGITIDNTNAEEVRVCYLPLLEQTE